MKVGKRNNISDTGKCQLELPEITSTLLPTVIIFILGRTRFENVGLGPIAYTHSEGGDLQDPLRISQPCFERRQLTSSPIVAQGSRLVR